MIVLMNWVDIHLSSLRSCCLDAQYQSSSLQIRDNLALAIYVQPQHLENCLEVVVRFFNTSNCCYDLYAEGINYVKSILYCIYIHIYINAIMTWKLVTYSKQYVYN